MNKLFLFLFVFLLFPLVASAQMTPLTASEWQRSPEVAVRLLSGVTASAESLPLGLEIDLKQGWKTYWRNAGAAGYGANIDWAGSSNLGAVEILWPAPKRFEYGGLQSFGYDGRLILPLMAKALDPTQPVHAQGAVEMMACEHTCIPFTFNVTLDIPAGNSKSSLFAYDIEKWQKRVPQQDAAGLSIVEAKEEGGKLIVSVLADPPLNQPDLFADETTLPPPVFTQGHPALLTVSTSGFAGTNLTFTLVDGERSVTRTVKVAGVMTSAPPEVMHFTNFLSALVAAFIGGVILNLMPCVLPVLSLKLLAVVSHANSPPAHVRNSFLASAAGILVSFLALAGAAIAFKQTGEAVGWGVQFQHPVFLGSLIFILTFFAASMWDLAHIPLPRFVADAVNDRLPKAGEHDSTLMGNFFMGAFATLLATPCSAPFVGTAIGFALAGGAVEILSIATMMGLGLALPFLLVAAFPKVARYLPKPGAWIAWLRGALGIALMLTALWLATVLGVGHKPIQTAMIGGSVFLMLFILWIRASIKRPIVLLKGILAITISVFAMKIVTFVEVNYLIKSPEQQIAWQPFNESQIPTLVASGKTVFVDVTASWCLTCKANKALVLEAEPTLSRLKAENVIPMQADWTKPDPAIGAYLKKFGRYGIPFNIVYSPAAPNGKLLPELLTAEAVGETLLGIEQ